jgi:hypothetical protein
MLAAGAATLLLWAAPAHAVTIVVHMHGPGRVKDVHAGGTLDCVTPEGQPASGLMDCSAEYGVFSGPELQASVPAGWAGGQRFVGFDQPHTGEIDCDDAPLASAICTFGTGLNVGVMYVNARFADTTAPLVSFTGGPSTRVASTSASFTFSRNDPVSGFECNRDSLGWVACSSGVTYSGLSRGAHSLAVRGRDPSGNLSAAVTRSWTVDTTVSLDSTPAAITRDTAPRFTFSASGGGASFECALGGDGGHDWQPCTSPRSYPGLPEGHHTFEVRAGEDDDPASFSFSVDRTPPGARIAGGPPSGLAVTSTSVTFALLSDENGATFECSFDAAAWAPCTNPITLTGLTPGIHELDARATDAAGNTDTAPVRRSFVVKLDQGSGGGGGGGGGGSGGTAGSAPPQRVTITLAFFARATAKSTRLTRLSVTGVPAGASVVATCTGSGCPRKTFRSIRPGNVSLTPFRTTLRAGAKITVRVTKPGTTGAVKVLTVRKSKPPLITTLCLPPGASKATSC